MSRARDVIVVGAGHNGLTAACLLARAGRDVLLLERRSEVGGLAAATEFHPGYRSPGLFHDATGIRPQVIERLGLARHGLRLREHRPDLLALADDGTALLVAGDPGRAAREIAARSPRDGERYEEFQAFLDRVRGVLRGFLDRPPVDLVSLGTSNVLTLLGRAWGLRRLGKTEMTELLRLPPMCVADLLGERLETELLKAALALPAVACTFMGPRSPGSAANLLLHEGAAGPGIHGGGSALVAALSSCASDAGVEIRTGAGVAAIEPGPDGSPSVIVAGGERIAARTVAVSCDPKQLFLRLLPAGAITGRLERRIRDLRSRGTTAQLLLALSSPVAFAAAAEAGVEHACLAGSLDRLERAHDAVKYRRCPEEPALEIFLPAADADLAPAGHAVASVLVHFAPRDLETGWSDSVREDLADRVVAALEPHLPGIGSQIVARRMHCPETIEATYGVTGGHPHHTEHALDQLLVRPVPECVGYRTPVPGLFLCGSGSHPGGGLTCAPGALAASAILAA